MKAHLIILICLLFLNCNQKQNNEDYVDSFVKNMITKNEDWRVYIDLGNNSTEDIDEIIKAQIEKISEIIKENKNEYFIVHHKNLNKHFLNSTLKYSDYSNVFYLVCDNRFVAPIIVENGKIISFFYGLTKHQKKSYPLILNKSFENKQQ